MDYFLGQMGPGMLEGIFFRLPFVGRGVGVVDLPGVLRDFGVGRAKPSCVGDREPPIVGCGCRRPIRGVVFGCTSVGAGAGVLGGCHTSCGCGGSGFRCGPCGRVIAGDLGVVEDREVIGVLRGAWVSSSLWNRLD